MDICVSSNFERFLYHMCEGGATELKQIMQSFENTGKLPVSDQVLANCRKHMCSTHVQREDILSTIQSVHKSHNYVLDPHSAVGFCGASRLLEQHAAECAPVISL